MARLYHFALSDWYVNAGTISVAGLSGREVTVLVSCMLCYLLGKRAAPQAAQHKTRRYCTVKIATYSAKKVDARFFFLVRTTQFESHAKYSMGETCRMHVEK